MDSVIFLYENDIYVKIDNPYFDGLKKYYEKKKQNIDDVKQKYIMEISKGNKLFMYNLGLLYQELEHNNDIAKTYYMYGANNGDSYCMMALGVFYSIIEKNNDQARHYLELAIEKNNIAAMNCLAFYYHSIEKNHDMSKKYYQMAISNGDIDALNYLGYFYQKIEKNIKEAKIYYKKAIEKGNSDAMNNMAALCDDDNDKESHYLMAIEKNNIVAMANLAIHYEKLKQYDKAKMYYIMATEGGEISSLIDFAHYYKNIEHNYFLAKKYFKIAMDNGEECSKDYDFCVKKIKEGNGMKFPINLKLLQVFKSSFRESPDILIRMIKDNRDVKYAKEELNKLTIIERYLLYKDNNMKFTEKSNELNIFINKCNIGSKNDICCVCLTPSILCIPTECFHYMCVSCYVLIIKKNRCPECLALIHS